MNVRQAFFPYGMQQQEDGSWVFFNRAYKPVGMVTSDYITYSDHPVSIRLKGLGPATRAKLDIDGEGGAGDTIYFYDDASQPTLSAANMQAYLKRLEILLRLEEAHD